MQKTTDMKQAILVVTTILFFGCGKCQTGTLGNTTTPIPKPLIIISGESNSGGYAQNIGLDSRETSMRQTLIFNNTSFTFQPLLIGVNNLLGHVGLPDNETHGLENGIANSGDSGRLGNTPVYILKTGFGAARIRYYNDSTNTSYLGQNPWQILKPRVDSAIKIMNNINGQTTPLFLVWVQGINDSSDGLSSAVWKDSTKSFFTKFRLRYGNVPIFMVKSMPPWNSGYDDRIDEICTEVSDCYAVESTGATLRDTKHWNAAGFRVIATRLVQSITTNYKFY